jgi:hypothetical protein
VAVNRERMSGFPLKMGRLALSRNGCGCLSGALPPGSLQSFDEHGHMPIPVNLTPLTLSEQDSGGDPAEPVIAALPAFDLLTDFRDSRESRFDGIRAGQGFP